jgi:hypothetical protein
MADKNKAAVDDKGNIRNDMTSHARAIHSPEFIRE